MATELKLTKTREYYTIESSSGLPQMTKHTRRAFFATLFAPLLTKLLPAPKAKPTGEAMFWLTSKYVRLTPSSHLAFMSKYRQIGMTTTTFELTEEQMNRSMAEMRRLLA